MPFNITFFVQCAPHKLRPLLIVIASYCGEPAISHDSHHVSLVQWTTCLLPTTRDSGSNPLGGLMWNWDSPVSVRNRSALRFFLYVCFPLYWYKFFIILRQKLCISWAFLRERKRSLLPPLSSFLFFARKLAIQKVLPVWGFSYGYPLHGHVFSFERIYMDIWYFFI